MDYELLLGVRGTRPIGGGGGRGGGVKRCRGTHNNALVAAARNFCFRFARGGARELGASAARFVAPT